MYVRSDATVTFVVKMNKKSVEQKRREIRKADKKRRDKKLEMELILKIPENNNRLRWRIEKTTTWKIAAETGDGSDNGDTNEHTNQNQIK